jgi:SAM-dependent methyltransferase
MSTDRDYTARLQEQTGKGWKRLLGAQVPYRRHIRRVVEGRVLDVGCGIGRNLQHLDGNGVGVDTNPHSIEVARSSGLTAYTSDEFAASPDATPGEYGSLLFAHVLEHMTSDEASSLLGLYLPYLRDGGRVVVIVPQEAGFRSDPTHVTFLDLDDLAHIEAANGLVREVGYSFPFPRSAGRVFTHNETVALSRKAPSAPL